MLPDDILENAPKGPRIIQVEANVIAYFGDLFQALKEGLKQAIDDPKMSARIIPRDTASAHNPS